MTTPLYWNYCKFVAAAGGTSAFTVSSAAPSDGAGAHDVPENCNVVNGNTYKYFATNGTQTEFGFGAYSTATHTLARTTISTNSDNTTTPVNFTSAPTVDLFPNPTQVVEFGSANMNPIPSGTLMLFQQSSAPTGWTKQTTHNDKALRVVSGTAGSGGTNSFSSTFSYRTDDAVTLSIGQTPSHNHASVNFNDSFLNLNPGAGAYGNTGNEFNAGGTVTTYTGGSGSHAHTYDMRVQYVDLIIAQKN